MLTSRGWWFLVVVLLLLLLGILGRHALLALLGLALLFWFISEWLLFSVRSRIIVRGVTLTRSVAHGDSEAATLWAGQTVRVRVEVGLTGQRSLPYAAIADWVPFGLELGSGFTRCDGALRVDEPLRLDYEARCSFAGKVRFEGVRLQLADYQGFFYHATFIPDVVVYRVLPRRVDASGHPATTKRHNLLPPPGIHSLRRPGSGSELLDLRDYLPGDPPKTIAWKVSARRDRLITKEFESEVPVRCTLFLDTSNSVRVGGMGQNPLKELIEIGAGAAQANAANRDLTGLCLFDEQSVDVLRPARGSRHLAKVINRLVDVAPQMPTTAEAPIDNLMPLAYTLAQEVYPYLLRSSVNQVPFWLPWLWPVPAEMKRPASWARRICLMLFVSTAMAGLAAWVAASYLVVDLVHEQLPPGWQMAPLLVDLSILASLIVAIPFVRIIYRALPLVFSVKRRRLSRWRKQLASVFAFQYRLGPSAVGRFLEDDEQFSLHLQRFLGDHQVPYTLPLYDSAGRYRFAEPAKIEVLARALLQSIGKGHDNELFVIMADLLELADHLDPLLRAVRVALARHHQVVVVCPWPQGLPKPEEHALVVERESEKSRAQAHRGSSRMRSRSHSLPVPHALHHAFVVRSHETSQQLRRMFARLGVPVVWSGGSEPVHVILERMNRLRGLGRRR